MKKYIVLALCVVVLVIVLAGQAVAQPEISSYTAGKNHQQQPGQVNSVLPDEHQKNAQISETPSPVIWFGLIISLFGAVVFWASVLWMARRRPQREFGHIRKISF